VAVAVLVTRLYIAHVTILKSEIKALESEFLQTHSQIEAIERGDLDAEFQKQLDQQQQRRQTPAKEDVETPAKEENVETPASTGNKRSRGGRRKGASATPSPAVPDTTEEIEEEIEGESPAKRSRKGTETDDIVEKPVLAKDEDEDQPMQEEPLEEQEEEKPAIEGQEPTVEEEGEQEEKPTTPSEPENPEVVDVDNEETEEESKASPEPTTSPNPANPDSDGTIPNFRSMQPKIIVETPARKQKAFSTLIHPLHASLCSLRSATLFSNPIREQDAPGYSSLVLKPTDLKTIWKQVKEGIITESIVFHREVARMFANAIVYNAENCNAPRSRLQRLTCGSACWGNVEGYGDGGR